MSKNKAVPIEPTTGIIRSTQRAVIGGYPQSIGMNMLHAANNKPMAIKRIGLYLSNLSVFSVPCAKLCNTNAMEATKPPTKPPPGRWCPRKSKKIEKSNKIGNKYRTAVFRMILLIGFFILFQMILIAVLINYTHPVLQCSTLQFQTWYPFP